MFVDKACITVKGGDGGNGCSSFRREKFVPKGGPDGGDGGRGGDVILETKSGEQSLASLVFNRHFKAKSGPHGSGKKQHGRRGEDCRLSVPVGTIIRDAETKEFIVDLNEEGMSFVIAEGGRGGRGNARFATSTNRAPRRCEPGIEGQERIIELELKTIADVGLVGFPNAGKSTLLGAVSAAKPKTAPYPFTTLHPMVGVVEFEDFTRLTIADIPGLIEGAHDNVGLGHEFLKHIERTKLLCYVLDMAGVDGRHPWEDFEALKRELDLYMKGLSERPTVVIANKMDIEISQENLELLEQDYPNITIIPMSAANDNDFELLRSSLREKLAEVRAKEELISYKS
ncbi:GTPase ObgE [Lentisphaerota bacterium WC36G]|nr:GTPase ObgE [Lentisphaerae bacterium WC36]